MATFNDRSGIIAGSGGGTYNTNYDFLPLIAETKRDLHRFGSELSTMVSPMWLLRVLPNNVLCHVGIRNQLKGHNACVTNQCIGGLQAVAESVEAIRTGAADRMVAVGHDAPFEPENVLYYYNCGLMSGEAPRPFDKDRDGTVFGEGAAAVALENGGSGPCPGADVFGEVLGSGCVSEATGILDCGTMEMESAAPSKSLWMMREYPPAMSA